MRKRVCLSFNDKEHETLQNIALKNNLKLSTFLRKIVMDYLDNNTLTK